jgi:hypothetical protein
LTRREEGKGLQVRKKIRRKLNKNEKKIKEKGYINRKK